MTRQRETSCIHWTLVTVYVLTGVVPVSAQRRSPRLLVLREMQHDVSPPLWQMAARAIEAHQPAETPEGSIEFGSPVDGPVRESDEHAAVLQFATIGLNFEGISAAVDPGQLPPDTNGAVGATQFVQWVNVEYAVYSKTTGALILGPLPGNTIWSGFPGPCSTTNSGQPIAQYDKAAGRWVLVQPVLVSPFAYCIAVSTSSDATGSYYRYAFTFPNGDYPDYGKLAIWPDAYYASFNIYQDGPAGPFLGPMVVAYDRTSMVTGGTARGPIAFQLTRADFSLLPSDFDGTLPPATGEPDFYLELGSDDDSLDLFKFHVDFGNPGGSSFTGPTPITTNAYRGCTRKPSSWDAIQQPPPGAKLESLSDRLMYRLAWRNISGVEHLVANHTVMPAAGTAAGAVRWYDITDPDGTPIVSQQGTFSSGSTSFWMGSIAMDKLGDIALGFSASSATLDPSIAYTGRLSTDPPGHMEGAKFIKTGSGVQRSSSLWGAYSSMSVDPGDDCTFWYTTEYIKTTGEASWNTRIASLKFPSCM